MDQGCLINSIKEVGNTNQETIEVGNKLNKKDPKCTNRKIKVLITISFKTILACLY